MGVTVVVCVVKGCGTMLNGETCQFVRGKPVCWVHGEPISRGLLIVRFLKSRQET